MQKVKYKIFDNVELKIVDYINCSVTSNGEVQSFGKDGVMEGTLKNRHLIPLLYTGKKCSKGIEIYDGYIVKRINKAFGEEVFIGVVVYDSYGWWLENRSLKETHRLESKTAIDEVIGNIFINKELAKELGF